MKLRKRSPHSPLKSPVVAPIPSAPPPPPAQAAPFEGFNPLTVRETRLFQELLLELFLYPPPIFPFTTCNSVFVIRYSQLAIRPYPSHSALPFTPCHSQFDIRYSTFAPRQSPLLLSVQSVEIRVPAFTTPSHNPPGWQSCPCATGPGTPLLERSARAYARNIDKKYILERILYPIPRQPSPLYNLPGPVSLEKANI